MIRRAKDSPPGEQGLTSVQHTTTTDTKWFPRLGLGVPGLETTIRGDGSYDNLYELVKQTWLIEHGGKRDEFATFAEFWRALSPPVEEFVLLLPGAYSEFLHLLHHGLDCGRPISRHPLWDLMDEVEEYRDYRIHDGTLSFFVYECSDILESPAWRRIARIDFNIAEGTHSRHHVADLPRYPVVETNGG